MQVGLVSMYCFHWLINKETAWPDRSEHRQEEQTEQNAGKKGSESDVMTLLSETDTGQNPPGKLPPRGATQMIRNELIKM